MTDRKQGFYEKYVKLPQDICLAAVGLIVLIPVLLIVAILIRVKLGTPVIFRQERAGKNGRPYYMYKFRSMSDERDENGELLPDELRLTKYGKFLRSTSLDELPELLNILVGHMSIVGPRPMLDYQAPRCEGDEVLRFKVRPGMTGLAQAKGRNNISWTERIRYDIEYVNNFSFWLDIKIIFGTALMVFKHTGTEVKPEYRGVDRFSKHYVPEENKTDAE